MPKYSQQNYIFKIVKSTLQNEDKLHFFVKKFAYIKKKQYLCTRFKN